MGATTVETVFLLRFGMMKASLRYLSGGTCSSCVFLSCLGKEDFSHISAFAFDTTHPPSFCYLVLGEVQGDRREGNVVKSNLGRYCLSFYFSPISQGRTMDVREEHHFNNKGTNGKERKYTGKQQARSYHLISSTLFRSVSFHFQKPELERRNLEMGMHVRLQSLIQPTGKRETKKDEKEQEAGKKTKKRRKIKKKEEKERKPRNTPASRLLTDTKKNNQSIKQIKSTTKSRASRLGWTGLENSSSFFSFVYMGVMDRLEGWREGRRKEESIYIIKSHILI